MTDPAILKWFPYAFPILFVGTWLLMTSLVGLLSGWFNLQQWYPDDGSEEALLTLNRKSGSMGTGVGLNGVLRLRSYPSGLGLGISRIFAPFQKPLKIPWSEIEAEPSSSFFVPMVKLNLGKPANGRLKISARSWSRLIEAVPSPSSGRQFQMPAAIPVSAGSFARALIIQWAVMSAAASVVFTAFFMTAAPSVRVPLALCVGFPIVVFGIGQLIRYGQES
ncbi:MAG TPA: hypothetical protein VGQ34_10225 [Sphingomicrobium sp.]|nr:hypothetical protein [Sphingomicrobium sp.]